MPCAVPEAIGNSSILVRLFDEEKAGAGSVSDQPADETSGRVVAHRAQADHGQPLGCRAEAYRSGTLADILSLSTGL